MGIYNCNQPKKSEKQIVKSIKFIGLPFHDILTRTMFKNTYTDIEVKKNVSIITKTTNKITLKIPSLLPYYQNLNCMKKKIFITQDKLLETCFLLKTYRFTQRLYPSLFNNIS